MFKKFYSFSLLLLSGFGGVFGQQVHEGKDIYVKWSTGDNFEMDGFSSEFQFSEGTSSDTMRVILDQPFMDAYNTSITRHFPDAKIAFPLEVRFFDQSGSLSTIDVSSLDVANLEGVFSATIKNESDFDVDVFFELVDINGNYVNTHNKSINDNFIWDIDNDPFYDGNIEMNIASNQVVTLFDGESSDDFIRVDDLHSRYWSLLDADKECRPCHNTSEVSDEGYYDIFTEFDFTKVVGLNVYVFNQMDNGSVENTMFPPSNVDPYNSYLPLAMSDVTIRFDELKLESLDLIQDDYFTPASTVTKVKEVEHQRVGVIRQGTTLTFDQKVTFKVFDLTGNVVSEGVGSQTELPYLSTIYLVQITDDEGKKTIVKK